MSKVVRVLPAARVDITTCFAYLHEHSGTTRAWHFIKCLDESFQRLQQMPLVGVKRQLPQTRLRNLRQWPVKEFTDYLIFYRVTRDRIDVVRILHGRRDLDTIFAKLN